MEPTLDIGLIVYMKNIKEGIGGIITLATIVGGIAMQVGCATSETETGEKPVRYVKEVAVVTYDNTRRNPTTNIRVFSEDELKGQKFHVIAKLSRNGRLQDQPKIENAIIWRARQIGGEGIIWLPVNQPRGWRNRNAEPIFSANVVVRDEK